MASNKLYLTAALSLAVGVAVGAWAVPHFEKPPTTELLDASLEQKNAHQEGARLTNPLLDCADLPNAISDGGVEKLHDDLESYIDAQVRTGDLITASVYYRDLNNGPWTSLNGSNNYPAGSLLKVPLAMAIYKKAGTDAKFLDKRITYTPDPSVTNQNQPYQPKENVVAGKSYTVKELVTIMLEQSSNEAAVTLANLLTHDEITGTYSDLGLTAPDFGEDYTITVRNFSAFLRILYNATYLSRDSSETILDMLTHSSYTDGIAAGISHGTLVAHKFGSRSDTDTSLELNDCGIVYNGPNPYLLCVMAHGTNFNTLSSVIAHISSMTAKYAATKQ